jgi:hypothetical protein
MVRAGALPPCDDESGLDSAPSLALAGDVLYCAYQNNEKNNWRVMCLRGRNFGRDWDATPLEVFETDENCHNPSVAYSAGMERLVFGWHDNSAAITGFIAGSTIPCSRSSARFVRFQMTIRRRCFRFAGPALDGALCLAAGRCVAGKFTDVQAPMLQVMSATHPLAGWSDQQVATLQWQIPADESGIDGYATIVNQIPDFDPTVRNLEGNTTRLNITVNEDGVHYFHIRAIDRAGNYGRTVHYPLRVSRNPLPLPDVESPTHPEGQAVAEREARFSWKQFGGERVRGFLYSLSKDTMSRPENVYH